MLKDKNLTEAVSRQVDALLAGQQLEHDDPLLATAQLLLEAKPPAPSPVFAQRLRRQLLQAGATPVSYRQERSILMWKRFAAVSMMALLIIALVWVALPRSLNAQQVLARAAKSTAVQPGQIVYQVYSSRGSLYREWQRLEVAPDGAAMPVETMTIRYAKDDLAFTTPLEWVYNSPTRTCRLPQSNTADAASEVDAEGCQIITPAPEPPAAPSDSTELSSSESGYTEALDPAVRQQIQEALREAPDAPDAPIMETIQGQIARLQNSSESVSVEQTQLEQRQVYAIVASERAPQPDEDTFTRTLYVDPKTFAPVGYSYSARTEGSEMVSWSAIIFEYRVLDADALGFDPFAWPPTTLP